MAYELITAKYNQKIFNYSFKITEYEDLFVFNENKLYNYNTDYFYPQNAINVNGYKIELSNPLSFKDLYIFRFKRPVRLTNFKNNRININDFEDEFENIYELIFDYKDFFQNGYPALIEGITKYLTNFLIARGQIVLKNKTQVNSDYIKCNGLVPSNLGFNIGLIEDLLDQDLKSPDYTHLQSLNGVNTNDWYMKINNNI